MVILYIALVVIILGIIYVAWLIWNEDKSPASPNTPAKKAESFHLGLLDRLGLKKESNDKKLFKIDFLNLFKVRTKDNRSSPPITGTAALKLEEPSDASSDAAPLKPEQINTFHALQKEFKELQDKYHKLDNLFQEKCILLSKTEVALDNELKNRKEFNKVKDLLEKELKDSREKHRDLKIEATQAQTEVESQKKRIAQLEEKILNTEKEIQSKNEALEKALKETQGIKNQGLLLETQLQNNEVRAQTKDKKIEELVNRLKDAAIQPVISEGTNIETPAKQISESNGNASDITSTPANVPAVKETPKNPPESEEKSEIPLNIGAVDTVTKESSEKVPKLSKKTESKDVKNNNENISDDKTENEQKSEPTKTVNDKTQGLKNLLDTIEKKSPISDDPAGSEVKETRLEESTAIKESTPESKVFEINGIKSKELTIKPVMPSISNIFQKNTSDSRLPLAPDVLNKKEAKEESEKSEDPKDSEATDIKDQKEKK